MEFYQKAFFVVLAALVGYGLLLVMQPFAGSLTWAIFLAFILYPVHRWMTRRFRGRASVSAGILTALTPFALLIPLVFLGIVFANQARALVAYIKESNIHLDETMFANLEQYRVVGPLVKTAREQLSISGADMQEWLTNSAQTVLHHVASFSGGFFLSAVGTLVSFFFMLFLMFFMI